MIVARVFANAITLCGTKRYLSGMVGVSVGSVRPNLYEPETSGHSDSEECRHNRTIAYPGAAICSTTVTRAPFCIAGSNKTMAQPIPKNDSKDSFPQLTPPAHRSFRSVGVQYWIRVGTLCSGLPREPHLINESEEPKQIARLLNAFSDTSSRYRPENESCMPWQDLLRAHSRETASWMPAVARQLMEHWL